MENPLVPFNAPVHTAKWDKRSSQWKKAVKYVSAILVAFRDCIL